MWLQIRLDETQIRMDSKTYGCFVNGRLKNWDYILRNITSLCVVFVLYYNLEYSVFFIPILIIDIGLIFWVKEHFCHFYLTPKAKQTCKRTKEGCRKNKITSTSQILMLGITTSLIDRNFFWVQSFNSTAKVNGNWYTKKKKSCPLLLFSLCNQTQPTGMGLSRRYLWLMEPWLSLTLKLTKF